MKSKRILISCAIAAFVAASTAILAKDPAENRPAPKAHREGPTWGNGKFWKTGEAKTPVSSGAGTVQAGYVAMTRTEKLYFPLLWSYCSKLCGAGTCTEKVCRPPHGDFKQSQTQTEEMSRQLSDTITSAVKSSSTFEKSFNTEAQWKLGAGGSMIASAEFTGKMGAGLKAGEEKELSQSLSKTVGASVKAASATTTSVSVEANPCQASELTYWMVVILATTEYERAVKYLDDSGERRGPVMPESSWNSIHRKDNDRAGGNDDEPRSPEITVTLDFELEGPTITSCKCADPHDAPPVPTPSGGNGKNTKHSLDSGHDHGQRSPARQILAPPMVFAEGTVSGVVTGSQAANTTVTSSVEVANGTVTAVQQTDDQGRFTLHVPKEARSILLTTAGTAGASALISKVLSSDALPAFPSEPPRLVQAGRPVSIVTDSPLASAEYVTPSSVTPVPVATAVNKDGAKAINTFVSQSEPGNAVLRTVSQSGHAAEYLQTAYSVGSRVETAAPERRDFVGSGVSTVKTRIEVGRENANRQYRIATNTTGPVTATPDSQLLTADVKGTLSMSTILRAHPIPGQTVPYTTTMMLQEAASPADKALQEAEDHEKAAEALEKKQPLDHKKAADERKKAGAKYREAEQRFRKAGDKDNAEKARQKALDNFGEAANDLRADGAANQGTKAGNDSFNEAARIDEELGDTYRADAERGGPEVPESLRKAAEHYDRAAEAHRGSGAASKANRAADRARQAREAAAKR